jgi:hypothetical protein
VPWPSPHEQAACRLGQGKGDSVRQAGGRATERSRWSGQLVRRGSGSQTRTLGDLAPFLTPRMDESERAERVRWIRCLHHHTLSLCVG